MQVGLSPLEPDHLAEPHAGEQQQRYERRDRFEARRAAHRTQPAVLLAGLGVLVRVVDKCCLEQRGELGRLQELGLLGGNRELLERPPQVASWILVKRSNSAK